MAVEQRARKILCKQHNDSELVTVSPLLLNAHTETSSHSHTVANFNPRMPPANTDALGQKKYDFVSPALDHLQISAAGAGPSAAAGFSSSGKGNERVPDVDTGPTLEEQQRRFQTASVIGDWEISAWYSVAGREVGLPLKFSFPSSFYTGTLTSPPPFILINEASYRIQLSDDPNRILTR